VHFHVRPRDSGDGWVVDRYDGRGSWSMTDGKDSPWSLQEARRVASKHTRLAINDGFNRRRVNRAPRCEHLYRAGYGQCGHAAANGGRFCGHHRRDK
jgi:hypothetical protein